MKNYKIVNGFSFNENTNNKVCEIISTRTDRLRIYYGDVETGKCWMDEYDTMGTIGRSMGQIKIPLLIKNSRSTGGTSILDDCILRIDSIAQKRILYKQANFNMLNVTVHECNVLFDGEIYAICESEKQAVKLAQFMRGERYSK